MAKSNWLLALIALITTVAVSLFAKGLLKLILTTGIGGAELVCGSITFGGIGLAAMVGVILNLIIPRSKSK